jgi:hypothetical protein
MSRYALIDPNGVTQNIIAVDIPAAYPLEEGWTLGDPDLHPMLVQPAPVPSSVSPRQLKLALLASGQLDQIEAFVASADKSVQISWEYTTEFQRDNPLLNQMAAAFGMTSDQVDTLFRAAANL